MGWLSLKELRSILEEVRSVDPFEHVTESDEEDASLNELLINQDKDNDDIIDKWYWYMNKSQLFFVTFGSIDKSCYILFRRL